MIMYMHIHIPFIRSFIHTLFVINIQIQLPVSILQLMVIGDWYRGYHNGRIIRVTISVLDHYMSIDRGWVGGGYIPQY